MQHLRYLRDAMPRQWSPGALQLPWNPYRPTATPEVAHSHTFIPREAEDFPRGDEHFKHVPLLTYLIYLSPKDLYR